MATVFATIEAGLNANPITKQGGRGEVVRVFEDVYVTAGDAAGTVIQYFTIPAGMTVTSLELQTDTSLGSATISVGDAANAAKYRAAAVLTGTFAINVLADLTTVVPGNLAANQVISITTATAALPTGANLVLRANVRNN